MLPWSPGVWENPVCRSAEGITVDIHLKVTGSGIPSSAKVTSSPSTEPPVLCTW